MKIISGKIMKKILKTLVLITFGISLFSCQVGLGEIVDMQAPVVTVNTPERTSYVQRQFSIIGTASDNTGISLLELTLAPLDNATEENTVKFRVENKTWKIFDNGIWKKYENELSTVTGSKTDYKWVLTYSLPESVATGTDYFITTQVYDEFNNEGKNSKDERSFTVDMKDPVVSLIAPSVRPTYNSEKDKAEKYALKDNSVLSNLLNGEFTISGSQKEDAKPNYLYVYIDEGKDYFSYKDSLEKHPDIYANIKINKKVEGDNLRNWSTKVNPSLLEEYKSNTGSHVLRIITESHDIAGNIETKVQGWFTYWNDADIPWINAAFGGNSYEPGEVASVYPSCALQGQAYDDDGLKNIIIKTYKDNSLTPIKEIVLDLEKENTPKYKAWSINALGENCSFRVEIEGEDIYGNKMEKVTRYMRVTDTNPPKIKIETTTNQAMLGDSAGKVTLKGYVTDDGEIQSLKLLRVKTGTESDKLIQYYDAEDKIWDTATANGAKDSNGNKSWILPLTTEITYLDDNNVLIHKRTFEKTFDIFTDFGIDGNTEKLTTQNFIIMATDAGKCSNIDSFTWAGDTVAPTLSIDEVKVVNGTGTKEIITFPGEKKSFQPFESGDKLIISGKWADDSTDNWNSTLKNKRGNVTLKLNNTTVAVTTKNDGTWTTGSITPPESTTVALSADFKDLAGNTKNVNECFFINSSKPELVRISAEQSDGSYKASSEILITLEFTKAVTFSGGSKPSLTLNVPGARTIDYAEGNGKTIHKFKYVVQNGDDVSLLNVSSINANGNIWKDVDGTVVSNLSVTGISEANRLFKTRSITIDTKSPELNGFSVITPAGNYSSEKEIFIQATFNEDVTVTDPSKIKLELNAATNLFADTGATVQTGPRTVLFTYKISANQNANPLGIKSISVSGAGIKDAAENICTTSTVPGATGGILLLSGIFVDTSKPTKPSINGVNDNDYIYENSGATFTITGFGDATVKKYSLDGGSNWFDYTGQVQIRDDGEYILTAKGIDAAGNESDIAEAKRFNIDAGAILTSVTAGVPTGTYTTGDEIPIYLNFRKNVVVEAGAELSLNLSNGQKATYNSAGSTGTKALFKYTIVEGDSSDSLNVTSITGNFKDDRGNTVNNYVTTIPTGKNLADSRIIRIVTGRPILQNVELSGTNLTLTFSKLISKGNGKNITISQAANTYKAPPVLTKAQYEKYLAAIPTLGTYYEIGTNGSDANCVSDLNEKYVLKYRYNIDGTWDNFRNGTDTNWLSLMTNSANADKVIVPVNSTYVSISGNKLIISLTNSYSLPVLGAEYTVQIPADLVKDEKNHGNEINSSYKINTVGISVPVIRIDKQNEKITKSGNTVTINQPLQASVKIDCQTPGTTCKYIINSKENATVSVSGGSTPKKITCNNAKPNTITLDNLKANKNVNTYSTSFNIGSDKATDYYKGYIFLIGAIATKNNEWSEAAYETAYRTAVTFKRDDTQGNFTYNNLFIRGGDNTYGGVTTTNMPFSWDSAEFDKIRAMTYNTDTWYWVTWKLNVTSYVGFVNGDYPNDVATNGPANWVWGDCGFVPYKQYYPLLPGGSLSFLTSTNWGTWVYQNQAKKKESRNGNTVTKG